MGSLWQGKTYLKNAASLLEKDCLDREGLGLSKKVLWVSGVGACNCKEDVIIQSLSDHNFTALWPTETQSISIKRSKTPLMTYCLTKRLAAFLR